MPQARKASNNSPLSLIAGRVEIDRLAHTVTVDGEPAHLSPTVYRLLELLALHKGSQVSVMQIAEALGNGTDVSTIRVLVNRLRKNLGPAADTVRVVRGEGYILAAD